MANSARRAHRVQEALRVVKDGLQLDRSRVADEELQDTLLELQHAAVLEHSLCCLQHGLLRHLHRGITNEQQSAGRPRSLRIRTGTWLTRNVPAT